MYAWFDVPLSLGYAGGVFKFFDWGDGVLNEHFRKELGNWLKNPPSQLPQQFFPTLMDQIAGGRVFSPRFLLASCAFGFLAFSVVVLVYIRLNDFAPDVVDLIPVYLLFALANTIPIVLSFMITRYLIHSTTRRTATIRVVALIFSDLLLKIVLGTVAVYVASVLIHLTTQQSPNGALGAVTSFYESSAPLPFLDDDGTAYGLFYYPIISTSLWLWFSLFGSALIKVINSNSRVIRNVLTTTLDIDNHPLRSVGLVVAAFSFLVVLLVSRLL